MRAEDVRHCTDNPSHLTSVNTLHESKRATGMNCVAMNICVQVFARMPVFNSFGSIPTGRMDESHDNSMFNFLREH